jgi:hypothetical protein
MKLTVVGPELSKLATAFESENWGSCTTPLHPGNGFLSVSLHTESLPCALKVGFHLAFSNN